jgi:response regulator NasT
MGAKIVIADDEPITRMDLKEILDEAGYNVVGEASDGFDAIELCKIHKPNLVLMDIKMPLLDGINAAKIIMNEELADSVVLLTAYSGKEFISKAKEIGVLGYLVKPIDEKSLLPTVEIALANSNEIKKMKKNFEKVNEKLEARKLIEKAKGIIMKEYNIDEEKAFSKIRTLSMEKRSTMQKISKAIIMNYESNLR